MAQNTHILELNGRRYNAMTGELLSEAQKSVDGFLPVATSTSTPEPVRPTLMHHETPIQHTDIHRAGAHHRAPHQLQHSKTLMRSSVHYPSDSLKRHLKAAPHTGVLVKAPVLDIVPKRSVDLIDPRRVKRSHTVPRSQLVRRFAADNAQLRATQPAVAARAAALYQQPVPNVQPSTAAHQPAYDVFEQALRAANSHKEPYRPVKQKGKKLRRARQVTSIVASSLAILLIIGFVAYQNSAVLQLRLAASRAGIAATLPSWQPSGFKLGTFSTGQGNLTVSYMGQAGQEFTIAQRSSNWDSSTLLSEYVYPNNETYDTLNSAGTTIYTYGQNNATWVNGGIWYKLTSNGSLSNSEIVNIATSMQS